MTALAWDQVGERLFETGVDHGVLYIPDETGDYVEGFAWNGLTTVTESPSGAESNPQFADNIKYLNLFSAEEFGATVEAFTYPDEFAQCDGTALPSPGDRCRSAGPPRFRTLLSDTCRQRSRGDGARLQAAPDLRSSGGSVGEGVRHDQRFARGDRILVGGHHHADRGDRSQSHGSAGDRFDQGG